MTESRNNTNAKKGGSHNSPVPEIPLNTMKKGYKEMAEINLSISKLYFEVEREVESYYDRIAECE